MAKSPKVSVIIPHYNMASFLPDAAESVVSQDYDNIELIIVDDGSEKKVDASQLTSTREGLEITVIEIRHQGKPTAVNAGFRKASGAYFAILDADDRLPEGSLSKRVQVLENNTADLCIGSFEVWYNGQMQSKRSTNLFAGNSNGTIIRKLLTDIIAPFHQNAMLFSRDLLERVGDMDSEMLRGQDKDFAVRLLRESRKTKLIEDSVYIYNRYDRPLTKRLANRLAGMKYKLLVIYRHFSGWRIMVFMAWGLVVETAKFVHDLFGVYKK